jgi:hypothetical protein
MGNSRDEILDQIQAHKSQGVRRAFMKLFRAIERLPADKVPEFNRAAKKDVRKGIRKAAKRRKEAKT